MKLRFTGCLMAVIILLTTVPVVYNQRGQDKWEIADADTVRLSPQVFRLLPPEIIRNLQARGCSIPQAFGGSEPHNVVSGEFMKEGQNDWAVLCSRNRRSSILLFWGGSPERVSAIAESPDIMFLQIIDGAGSIGFARAIDAVGRDYILKHYREYGGPKPAPINHQGIADAFVEKGSVVHYFYRRKWLKLQGAD